MIIIWSSSPGAVCEVDRLHQTNNTLYANILHNIGYYNEPEGEEKFYKSGLICPAETNDVCLSSTKK